MGILKKIIHILAILCYIVISIYALLALPIVFGNFPIVILSGSMKPDYNVGTIVYYHSVNEENIAIGDVIVFKKNQDVVCHRVNDIKNNLYETKGDANSSPDVELVEYKDILGKLAPLSVPLVGYLITFINKNHIYLIIGAVIILILEFVFANFNIDKIVGKEK